MESADNFDDEIDKLELQHVVLVGRKILFTLPNLEATRRSIHLIHLTCLCQKISFAQPISFRYQSL